MKLIVMFGMGTEVYIFGPRLLIIVGLRTAWGRWLHMGHGRELWSGFGSKTLFNFGEER
jgi:hypothetical protein